MKKKISLEKFEAHTLSKEELFHVLGGAVFSTKSNGHKTKSKGADGDDATSDKDESPAVYVNPELIPIEIEIEEGEPTIIV